MTNVDTQIDACHDGSAFLLTKNVNNHQAHLRVTGFINALTSPVQDGNEWVPGMVSIGPLQVAVPHELWPGVSHSLSGNGRGMVLICEAHLVDGHWIAHQVSALVQHAPRTETVTRGVARNPASPAPQPTGETPSAGQAPRQPATEPKSRPASNASPFASLSKGVAAGRPNPQGRGQGLAGGPARGATDAAAQRPAFSPGSSKQAADLTDDDLDTDVPF